MNSELVKIIFARAGTQTFACAESFTGGKIADAFVSVAGASVFFKGGIVAYETALKTKILGVPAELIEQFSVFSEPVARAMAEQVAKLCGTTCGIGTTGVAGPDDQDGVPAGTVFIAVKTPAGTFAQKLEIKNRSREVVREIATRAALELLREHL